MADVTVRVEGTEELKRALDRLDHKTVRKAIRKGVNAGSRVLLKAVKSRLSVRRTGQLRRSLGRKIKSYRNSGTIVAIVGPRRGFRTELNGRPVDPIFYAHLIEGGTKARYWKKGRVVKEGFFRDKRGGAGKYSGAMPAFPFMLPGFHAVEAQVQQLMLDTIAAAIEGK